MTASLGPPRVDRAVEKMPEQWRTVCSTAGGDSGLGVRGVARGLAGAVPEQRGAPFGTLKPARCLRCSRGFVPRKRGHVFCNPACRHLLSRRGGQPEPPSEEVVERLFDEHRDPTEQVREDDCHPSRDAACPCNRSSPHARAAETLVSGADREARLSAENKSPSTWAMTVNAISQSPPRRCTASAVGGRDRGRPRDTSWAPSSQPQCKCRQALVGRRNPATPGHAARRRRVITACHGGGKLRLLRGDSSRLFCFWMIWDRCPTARCAVRSRYGSWCSPGGGTAGMARPRAFSLPATATQRSAACGKASGELAMLLRCKRLTPTRGTP
jgi:hypothetical protein